MRFGRLNRNRHDVLNRSRLAEHNKQTLVALKRTKLERHNKLVPRERDRKLHAGLSKTKLDVPSRNVRDNKLRNVPDSNRHNGMQLARHSKGLNGTQLVEHSQISQVLLNKAGRVA